MSGQKGHGANLAKAKRIGGARFRLSESGRLKWAVMALLILAAGGIGAVGFLSGASAGRIAAGVSIGPVAVGEMAPDEAANALKRHLDGYSILFRTEGMEVPVNPLAAPADGSPAIASADAEAAVQAAYAVGRRGNAFLSAAERAGSYLFGKAVSLPIEVSQESLDRELKILFAGAFSPAVSAQVMVGVDAAGRVTTEVIPEHPGTNLDTVRAAAEAESRIRNLSAVPVTIQIRRDRPEISAAEAEGAAVLAAAAVARAPLSLTAKRSVWTVSKAQLASWLDAVRNQESGSVTLGFSPAAIAKYLESKAPEFAVAPADAVFEMKEGKVSRLEPHRNGEQLDIDGAIAALQEAAFGPEPPAGRIELPIRTVEPERTLERSNPYGIRDVIGIGDSNFRGSPTNRRINIAVGAATLNGMVIPAGTEFSLVKALGQIDGEHGYRQELVIKDNKTVPEYGGGLCQIGTTAFRAALNSALPVTERRNHSYRVSYYERDGAGNYMGPGKDATIYNPWPDFKFLNDTGHAIVIMTEIAGDRLTFTYWGAADGRTQEQGDVRVWDITPPPPKKLIPTPDLAPGVEKCTESPHSGAKAAFDYTITYADGTENKQNFYSLYRPWGEVCLIGIDPNASQEGGGDGLTADAAGAHGE